LNYNRIWDILFIKKEVFMMVLIKYKGGKRKAGGKMLKNKEKRRPQ
jgi:hypothetical protein